LRSLADGRTPLQRKPQVVDRIIGFALRVSIVFGFMESVVMLISVFQEDYQPNELLVVISTLAYFSTSTVILFARSKFWFTANTGMLLNAPLVYLLVKFRSNMGAFTYVGLIYLFLWLSFLLTRWRLLDSVFAKITAELRYYLID
jgi:hypothetical protein